MDEWPPEAVEVVEQARRNNQPRKHHLVPDFYLSRWAVDGVLKMHRLDENESFVTAPKNVARETDYYRVEAPGLDPDLIPPMILETVLSKVEGQGRPAIEILSQMPDAIDPITRFDMATFMAFQYCRGHRIRLRIAAMENELLKLRAEHEDRVSIRAALIEEGVTPTEQDISDVEEAIRALLKGDLTVAPENVSILGHMFGSSDMIAQLLFERAWVVARTSNSLVTCDEPVLPIGGPGWPRDEYSGAGSAGIVAFPLDSSHVLLALRKDLAARTGLSWAPDAVARTELTLVETAELSREFVHAATRWAFERPDRNLIGHFAVPRRHDDVTVEWVVRDADGAGIFRHYSANRWQQSAIVPNWPLRRFWPPGWRAQPMPRVLVDEIEGRRTP